MGEGAAAFICGSVGLHERVGHVYGSMGEREHAIGPVAVVYGGIPLVPQQTGSRCVHSIVRLVLGWEIVIFRCVSQEISMRAFFLLVTTLPMGDRSHSR